MRTVRTGPAPQPIAEGRRPTGLQPDEQAVYNFCTELLTTKQVSDPTFQSAVKSFGERGGGSDYATGGGWPRAASAGR